VNEEKIIEKNSALILEKVGTILNQLDEEKK
jgi:hypothetical protein